GGAVRLLALGRRPRQGDPREGKPGSRALALQAYRARPGLLGKAGEPEPAPQRPGDAAQGPLPPHAGAGARLARVDLLPGPLAEDAATRLDRRSVQPPVCLHETALRL